jgi:hypothetical protein
MLSKSNKKELPFREALLLLFASVIILIRNQHHSRKTSKTKFDLIIAQQSTKCKIFYLKISIFPKKVQNMQINAFKK